VNRNPSHIIKQHEPVSDEAHKDHIAMMREGSSKLVWGIMGLQAEREGPDAVRRFHIMQEFAHGNV